MVAGAAVATPFTPPVTAPLSVSYGNGQGEQGQKDGVST